MRHLSPLLTLLALAVGSGSSSAEAESPCSVPVILVHGMVYDLEAGDATWGRTYRRADGQRGWSGMVGHLEKAGLPYGGTIRPSRGQVTFPDDLDNSASRVSPHLARVFVLEFSQYANTDGVGYKAAELAETIRQVCRWTEAEKVRLVAHSAGGLVARVYLQNALPGVPYRGDVERLITIATPHLGSALASHWGDYLGTRATSIKPEAALIRDLNGKFDLPGDVNFASIVVRAMAVDSRDEGKELDGLIDAAFLTGLPAEYRVGGDEVVHVRSQNLRAARCAARYEKATGKPIQYLVARVADPTPDSVSLRSERVHIAAATDPTVAHVVAGMLNDRASLWKASASDHLAEWMDWQARLHAGGAIEAYTLEDHPMSKVSHVRVQEFRTTDGDGWDRRYWFSGKAWSKNPYIPLRRRWTEVAGDLDLEFDKYGRVRKSEATID